MVTVIKQYPHILKTTTASPEASYVNGKWVPGTGTVTDVVEICRAESSSGNGYLTQADGVKINFSWIVYFPLSVSKKEIGEKVTIYDGEELMITDTVKRFSRGQLNSRAWL
jgi:hypothetical protein